MIDPTTGDSNSSVLSSVWLFLSPQQISLGRGNNVLEQRRTKLAVGLLAQRYSACFAVALVGLYGGPFSEMTGFHVKKCSVSYKGVCHWPMKAFSRFSNRNTDAGSAANVQRSASPRASCPRSFVYCSSSCTMTVRRNALFLVAMGTGGCRAFSVITMSRNVGLPIPTLTSRLGFSFTPGGLLFPYHLGVAKCLELQGFLATDTPLAGSSAG